MTVNNSTSTHGIRAINVISVIAAITVVCTLQYRRNAEYRMRQKYTPQAHVALQAPEAQWPWPQAAEDRPHPGVRHWVDKSSKSGTILDLFEFDFTVNPRLRFEMYDQAEDDVKPFGNDVKYWDNSVGVIAKRLIAKNNGPVVAVWNGLFFDLDGAGQGRTAHHLTPIVLHGKLHYPDLPTYRWTFGVKYHAGRPKFDVLFKPKPTEMETLFDHAAGAAQCVIRDGKELKLEPFPNKPGYVPPAHEEMSDEAGYIRMIDHVRVSRTSIGWNRDSSKLYLLYVTAPDAATEAVLSKNGLNSVNGGWTLADIQRFWKAKGVYCAINSDGGGPAQLVYRRPDSRYCLLPAVWNGSNARIVLNEQLTDAPPGGALMYFYITEAPVTR